MRWKSGAYASYWFRCEEYYEAQPKQMEYSYTPGARKRHWKVIFAGF